MRRTERSHGTHYVRPKHWPHRTHHTVSWSHESTATSKWSGTARNIPRESVLSEEVTVKAWSGAYARARARAHHHHVIIWEVAVKAWSGAHARARAPAHHHHHVIVWEVAEIIEVSTSPATASVVIIASCKNH